MEFIITAVTAVFVQAIKENINSNYLPLVSVLTGLVIGLVIAYFTSGELAGGAITGITAGLMASGSYDLVKGLYTEAKGDDY